MEIFFSSPYPWRPPSMRSVGCWETPEACFKTKYPFDFTQFASFLTWLEFLTSEWGTGHLEMRKWWRDNLWWAKLNTSLACFPVRWEGAGHAILSLSHSDHHHLPHPESLEETAVSIVGPPLLWVHSCSSHIFLFTFTYLCHCRCCPQGHQQSSSLLHQLLLHVLLPDCIMYVSIWEARNMSFVFPKTLSMTNFMLIQYLLVGCWWTDCFSNYGSWVEKS